MAKFGKIAEHYYAWYCPGCKNHHAVPVNGCKNSNGAGWGWNGSVDAPTLTPSVLCNPQDATIRCHCFIRDGKIEFLPDCYHDLKGQTVEVPEYEE